MKVGSTLTYLHGDHLGSTVLETNSSGAVTTDEKYYAYGKQRDSGKVTTDHRFTGQKEDSSGLMYYASRYYDPSTGLFVSPDTIVPDAGLAVDYNRFMYARGNSLKYNDPSGHCAELAMPAPPCSGLLQQLQQWVYYYGPQVSQWAQQLWPYANQGVAAAENMYLSADQASQGSAQQSGQGNTGNTPSSGGDPNDPFNRFKNLIRDRGSEALGRDLQSANPGNQVGAQRVMDAMNKVGVDKVQRVGLKIQTGQVTNTDIDFMDIQGNIYEVGSHTASQLGQKFQAFNAFLQQSQSGGKIVYYYTGPLTKDIIDTAARWGVELRALYE